MTSSRYSALYQGQTYLRVLGQIIENSRIFVVKTRTCAILFNSVLSFDHPPWSSVDEVDLISVSLSPETVLRVRANSVSTLDFLQLEVDLGLV